MLSKFDKAKCRLCSRLSSGLEGLLFRLVGRFCCAWIHRRTSPIDFPDRVAAINDCAPNCACERYKMSRHSPGTVRDEELVERFVFSPMHVNKKTGKPMPNLFSHAEKKGCSIQRARASNDEIQNFATGFLENPKHAWLGVVSARCGEVRTMRLDGHVDQIACIYDTAEETNPSHAEICWTRGAVDAGDANELRKKLMDLFQADRPIASQTYRSGAVWRSLPIEQRRAVSR